MTRTAGASLRRWCCWWWCCMWCCMRWWCCDGAPSPAGPVGELPYRANMTELELLEHVLRNETEWRLVLNERVIGFADPPPHADRFAVRMDADAGAATATVATAAAAAAEDVAAAATETAAEAPADPAAWEYDPRTMAAAVVPRFSGVGSMVSFAARVVHRAAACLALRHLTFQAHYVTLLVAGKTEPAQLLADLSAFRGALVRVLDKLALVPGGAAELDVVLDAYWDTVALMQEDAVHHVRPKPYPQHANDVAAAVHSSFRAYMRANCARPYRADRRLFADAGLDGLPDELLLDDVLGALVVPDALVRLGRRHAAFVQRAFYGLAADALPRALWTQLFYHAPRLPPADPRDRVNPFVTRQPVAPAQLGAPLVAVNTVLQPGGPSMTVRVD